ncbi:MAG: hypothetical protein BA863_05210 [Desulfovibrio sp. S3730MH75]|nr:MAG: hypothetical protein BA863_05210 [Desulfovibrio sp. S3730MH75]
MNADEIIKELCKTYLEQGFRTVPPDFMDEYNWERQNLGGYPVVEQNPENFNDSRHHKRARQIGKILNEEGGFSLMQEIAYSVQNEIGSKPANELSRCWNGIGDWVD